jgi:hypothetical protein
MSETTQLHASNPFQEVCVYLSQQGNNLALAELIKRFGFTVYAFTSLGRMLKHLETQPLTAAVFVQGDLSELEPQVRVGGYHGPLYALEQDREQMLDTLGGHLREVHRNQMRIQDPKILRVLKAFEAFSDGRQKTLFLIGPEAALACSLEYLRLFVEVAFVEVGQSLPAPDDPSESAQQTCHVTRDLFSQSIDWQQRWNVRFGEASQRHLILETGDVAGLDARYLEGAVDELLYERLSFKQTDVSALADTSLEELAVQPLTKSEPRLYYDVEADSIDATPLATKNQPQLKKKSATKGFTRLLGDLLKRK